MIVGAMKEKENLALVPRSPSALEKAEAGPKRIVSGMVAEILALAQKIEITPPASAPTTEAQEWLNWHRRAAERGSRESLYQLGVAFLGGSRVSEDPVEGWKWLFLAACQGHGKACEYFMGRDFDYFDESFIEAQRRSYEFEETYNVLVPALEQREISSLAVTFAVTRSNTIKRVASSSHQAQGGLSRVACMNTRNGAGSGDFAEHIFIAKSSDRLMFFTDTGRVHIRFASEIADRTSAQESCLITSFLGLEAAETIVSSICVPAKTGPNNEDMTRRQHGFLFFTTQQGRVKRAELGDFAETEKVWARTNGMDAIGLDT